jgi:hypothetical protein
LSTEETPKAWFLSRICTDSSWSLGGASMLILMDLGVKDPDVDQMPRALWIPAGPGSDSRLWDSASLLWLLWSFIDLSTSTSPFQLLLSNQRAASDQIPEALPS